MVVGETVAGPLDEEGGGATLLALGRTADGVEEVNLRWWVPFSEVELDPVK